MNPHPFILSQQVSRLTPLPTVSLVLGLDSWSFWSRPLCVLHSQRHPQSSPGLLILHPGWLGCTFADDHRPGHTLVLAPAATIMDTGTQTHSTTSAATTHPSAHTWNRDSNPGKRNEDQREDRANCTNEAKGMAQQALWTAPAHTSLTPCISFPMFAFPQTTQILSLSCLWFLPYISHS